jgi:hypothetical protein
MRVKMPIFTDDPEPSQSSSQPIERIRPCIQRMMDSPLPTSVGREAHGLSHDARMAVAAEGFAVGWNDSQVAQMFTKQKDYSYSESLKQVKSLRKTWKGKPRKCDTLKANGWCPGECRNT